MGKYREMKAKYREKGEEGEIVCLPVSEYATLLRCLNDSRNHNMGWLKKSKVDGNTVVSEKAIMEYSILRLARYIDMLFNETELSDTKDKAYVPFFKNYKEELFSHMLFGTVGGGCIL